MTSFTHKLLICIAVIAPTTASADTFYVKGKVLLIETAAIVRPVASAADDLTFVYPSPEGERAVVVTRQGKLLFWRSGSSKLTEVGKYDGNTETPVAWSKHHMALCLSGNELVVFDEAGVRLKTPSARCYSMAWETDLKVRFMPPGGWSVSELDLNTQKIAHLKQAPLYRFGEFSVQLLPGFESIEEGEPQMIVVSKTFGRREFEKPIFPNCIGKENVLYVPSVEYYSLYAGDTGLSLTSSSDGGRSVGFSNDCRYVVRLESGDPYKVDVKTGKKVPMSARQP